jgi:hypothetical protein
MLGEFGDRLLTPCSLVWQVVTLYQRHDIPTDLDVPEAATLLTPEVLTPSGMVINLTLL